MRPFFLFAVATAALCAVCPAAAQPDARAASFLAEGRRALQSGVDLGSADSLMAASAAFALAARAADPATAAWATYHAALTDYRLTLHHAVRGDRQRAVEFVRRGVGQAEALAAQRSADPDLEAETEALLARLYGMYISVEPARGAELGPKGDRATERSLALRPDNPRVALFNAIGLYNTPPEWGGDPDRAVDEFVRAAALFEEEGADPVRARWGADEPWIWLGQAYLDRGDLPAARRAIDRAAALNPRSIRVHRGLIPRLEQAEGAAHEGE